MLTVNLSFDVGHKYRMRSFVILTFSLISMGCGSNPTLSCMDTDWFELGRRHGQQGSTLNNNKKQLSNACSNNKVARQEFALQYENGYQAGLGEYCSADNALILGRTNIPYNDVCPEDLKDNFMTYYDRGLRISEIAENRRQIDSRLLQIRNQLVDPNTTFPRRALLAGEKIELTKKAEDLEKDVAASKQEEPQ